MNYRFVIIFFTFLICLLLAVVVNLMYGIDIVYTHLFYVPIILTGVWYPRYAGFVAAALGLIHIACDYYQTIETLRLGSLLRAGMFMVVAYVTGYLSSRRDRLLNSLRESQEALKQSHDELEERIADRTEDLMRVNEELRKDITRRTRAEQEVATLAEIGRVIGSTLDIKQVYEKFASITRRLIPFDALSVNLIDVPNDIFRIAYHAGLDLPGRTAGVNIPLAGTMTEHVMRNRKAMMFNASSVEEITRLHPGVTRALSIQTGFLTNMLIPLFANDAIIGILHFRAKKLNAYSDAEVSLAERIGMQIAEVISNARLYSDLSKTEKSLRESEERLRDIIFSIADWVWEVDQNGVYTYSSQKGLDLLGASREDIIGKTPFDFMPPDEAKRVAAIFFDIAAKKLPIKDLENLNIGKNGEKICLLTNGVPILDQEGNLKGYRGVDNDITERKRAEEERRGLEERLQRSEKMEALGQMAGGVAHDLNNILGILSGYSELLLAEIPEGHRSRRHAEKILQSTEKGAAIIQDLLTLARRGVVASDVINLNGVVSGFLSAPAFEKMKDYHPRVTFRAECDKNLLNIKGSPVHLEKVLMNLVANAAESIPGKGDVTIRTESRYLDKPVGSYDAVREGDYAVLTVSDTGTGIPAESIRKIFEPFYSKKAMGRSGTGLGLAIVWGTVKDHNGYIDVQTEVGKGTTFTLYFPATREEQLVQQQEVPIEQYRGHGESVLVVDDVAEQRDVAAGLLTRLGYKAHSVISGEEAVKYLEGHAVDILVLDMIMTPGIDGLETYKRVLEINPKQKAIIVSGFSETERVKEAQKLGAGAYVKKPYVMERIGLAIRDELNAQR
ncbi:MAG: hybrid sensor histidine kinase/response regulator [Syntrophales bacterium]